MPLDTKFLTYYSFDGVYKKLQSGSPHASISIAICGLLHSALQSAPGDTGQALQEDWLWQYPEQLPPWEPNAQARAAERAQQQLRNLHTVAQKLVCDCNMDIRVEEADGRIRETEPHGDFSFLQRGRHRTGAG